MAKVMQGIRILEVAEHTFVPAAAALLADWGADVIKIEHVERGDAMRGLAATGVVDIPTDVHALLEHSNRGKRSLGLDLMSEEGRAILYRLVETSDVFLTNKLPRVRKKLQIDLDIVRGWNPRIVYASGTGQGERGPEADDGSYDSLAFWARAGMAAALTRADDGQVPGPPAPGLGDSIGAMTIAGGIMGALFHRERTGEATTVDVSLLSTGVWAMGQSVALSLLTGVPWSVPVDNPRANPLARNYITADGRWLAFTCLQAGKYWPLLVEAVGRPELAADVRFRDHVTLLDNSAAAIAILQEIFAERSADEWRTMLAGFSGQWVVVQTALEIADDPQVVANGYVQQCHTSTGVPFRLAATPVQYGGIPSVPQRAPEFNEHGDRILAELGIDWDQVVDLKVRGVVA